MCIKDEICFARMLFSVQSQDINSLNGPLAPAWLVSFGSSCSCFLCWVTWQGLDVETDLSPNFGICSS